MNWSLHIILNRWVISSIRVKISLQVRPPSLRFVEFSYLFSVLSHGRMQIFILLYLTLICNVKLPLTKSCYFYCQDKCTTCHATVFILSHGRMQIFILSHSGMQISGNSGLKIEMNCKIMFSMQ